MSAPPWDASDTRTMLCFCAMACLGFCLVHWGQPRGRHGASLLTFQDALRSSIFAVLFGALSLPLLLVVLAVLESLF